jgi:hypothetical protein
MIRDALNLRSAVSVIRIAETNDGMGGISTTTTATVLDRAAIWQNGANSTYLSNRISLVSTHVLAHIPSSYTWTVDDRRVTYGGKTYNVKGSDDVIHKSLLTIVGLELVE